MQEFRRKATFLRSPLHWKAPPHSAPRHHPTPGSHFRTAREELLWPFFIVKAPLFHSLSWLDLVCFVWNTMGMITSTSLGLQRGRERTEEKWEMLQAGPWEGLVSHYALLLHFPNILSPFIFPMRWSGQSLREITGVKLRSHKCEGEEKVNIHCWTRDSMWSLCYRVREMLSLKLICA